MDIIDIKEKVNEFTFWSVGHGLFYTGLIGNHEFNFLYDCGSSNEGTIKNCIKHANLPEYFNFAVISHLHKDHVNGINTLLDKCHIRDYYFPYIGSDLIRDLIVANLVSHMEGEHKSIHSFDSLKERLDHSDVVWEEKTQNINSNDMTSVESNNGDDYEFLDMSFSRIIPCASSVSGEFVWEFTLFNQKMSKKRIIELDKAIEQRLKDAGYETIRDMISNEGIDSIKGIYNSTLKDKEANLSSTVLIHHPKESMGDSTGSEVIHSVLSGDIAFKKGECERLWSKLRDKNIILQLPHHGSYENWKSLKISGSKEHIFVIPSLCNQTRPSRKTINGLKKSMDAEAYVTGLSETGLCYEIPSQSASIASDWNAYRLRSNPDST